MTTSAPPRDPPKSEPFTAAPGVPASVAPKPPPAVRPASEPFPPGVAAAVGLESLIAGLCHQFTQATGWRLEFRPERTAVDPGRHHAACWERVLGNGHAAIGLLLLHTPRVETGCSFLQATELATGLSKSLEALAESQRRLASRTDDVSTLVNLGMTVPVRENLTWSLAQLLRGATRLTLSRSAAFFLLDPSLQSLRLRAVWQLESQDVPQSTREVLASRCDREALARGIGLASHGDGPAVLLPAEIRSGLVVPVESETMPLGTLWVYDRRARTYGEHERHVLQSVAAQIAGVLERVALLRGNEQHVRITRELEQATRAQPVLLPNDLPADPRYALAAHVASCHELGGDLCDIIPLADGRVGLAVGDASGHGIAAAMVMASVRGALRAIAAEDQTLPELMGRLNEALYTITRSHQFMSLCYGVFDPTARTLTYVNAGHPLPLLLRRGAITPLNSHGLLVGVIRETDYGSSTLELQPGDTVVFYTDGISEARCGREQMFRADGIASALVAAQNGTADEILRAIWNRVEHHLNGAEADDDRTLVVLQIS